MRHLVLSILIHSLLFISVGFKSQEKTEPTEIEFSESETQPQNVVVKELTAGEGEESKLFYWGIGISSSTLFDHGNKVWTHRVTEVHKGYSADLAGIMVGDVILLVNGGSAEGDNDLRGDGPKKLILTILRSGDTIIVNTERCKVYY